MKGIFLVNETIKESSGIGKKILNQYHALNELLIECSLCQLDCHNSNTVRLIDGQVLETFSKGKFGYIQSLFSYEKLKNHIKTNNIDFLYVRYTHFANPFFIKFLKQLKAEGVKVVCEVPTFPYDSEYAHVRGFRLAKFWMDKKFRLKMAKYIDHIVTFSQDESIWGVNTIRISNAVNPEHLPQTNAAFDGKRINFIAVANLAPWHGYDRFINSIYDYYQNEYDSIDIHFYLVGDGEELNKLKMLAESLGIKERVTFHGARDGNELDNIFSQAHIGVDSLGRHRSGNNFNNSLKSKEYLVRGIPVVKSHQDFSIDLIASKYICFNVSSSDCSFSIKEILEWYIKYGVDPYILSSFSRKKFSWKNQFTIMLKSLNNNV